tara:strand:- start:32 stop:535 length:504 start_codon:yes stop_codon:yes gene_type:complete
MAQEVLFITKEDVVRFTDLNGNTDVDRFLSKVKIAQDLDVQVLLGTRLFERLKTDIINDTLADPYLTLLEEKIKPIVIHYTMVQWLPSAPYVIGNKGVYKRTSENGQVVDANELIKMIENERSVAEAYAQRFIDYMCYNQSQFPEYFTNTNDDIYPTRRNYFNGWYI